jgi:peroxiredoxin/uncharacterized membrane protein YphA (DoxX/SURF4 family)
MEIILLLIRIFLAAIFIVAGIGKFLDLEGAEKSVKAFGTPEDLAKPFAIAIPFAEIVFGASLLFVSVSWIGAIGVFLFLLIFIGGMIWQLAQGKAPECHCFGAIHSEPVSTKSLIRNIIFAALALFLVAQGKDKQGLSLEQMTNETALQLILGLAIVGFLAVVVFYLKKITGQQSQIMRRIEALEITLHEGGMLEREHPAGPLEGLPIGAPAPDFVLPDALGNKVSLEDLLSRGKPLLFFYVGPNCAPCAALLPEIETWASELRDKVDFIFLSNGEREENIEKFGAAEILLQEQREVADRFSARWTPTAFLVNPQGTIASHLAVGDAAIRELAEKIKAENIEKDFFYISNGSDLKIGESVPEFSLEDLRGKHIGTGDLQGKKTLVAFWSMTCPHCTNMMEELKNWDNQKGADEPNLIVFSDGEAEAHKDLELDSPILLDKDYKTAEKFGMYGTPSAVLVDENGKIVSETAIGADNIWALIGKRK